MSLQPVTTPAPFITPTEVLLSADQATLGYGKVPVLKNLNGRLYAGEVLAVIGPNGGGKSTFLKAIIHQELVLKGHLVRPKLRSQNIAVLPQIVEVDRSFPITVEHFVQTGLWQQTGLSGRMGRTERQYCLQVLDQVGIADLRNRPIGNLSGGQFQRMRFARLLLQQAQLILLDEPFTGIDESTVQILARLMTELNQNGAAMVAVLHDQQWVAKLFTQTCLLAGRQIAWGATTEVLNEDNWQQAYGYPALTV